MLLGPKKAEDPALSAHDARQCIPSRTHGHDDIVTPNDRILCCFLLLANTGPKLGGFQELMGIVPTRYRPVALPAIA